MQHTQATAVPSTPIQVIELVQGLGATELDARVRTAARRGDVGNRELAFYLVDMEERGVHQMFGYATTVQYAVRRHEIARRTAQELLAAGRALKELPRIDQAFAEGRLSWTRVRLLTRIAVPETEAAWLEKSFATAPLAQFERIVATGERGRPPRTDGKGLPQVRFDVRGRLDAAAFETWEAAKRKRSAECGEHVSDADLMTYSARTILGTQDVASREPIDASIYNVLVHQCPGCHTMTIPTDSGPEVVDGVTAAVIRCDAACETMEPDAHRDDPTPPWLRRKIIRRDGGRCVLCSSTTGLNAHHVVFLENGGPTVPGNLTCVCDRCHAKIHAGLIVVNGAAPHGLVVTDRDGNALDLPAHVKTPADQILVMTPPAVAVAPPSGVVTFAAVTNVLSLLWWRLHQRLFTFADALGAFRFSPGLPQTQAIPAAAPVAIPAHRPGRLADVIGQGAIVGTLTRAARAAAKLGRAVDHALFFGEPGLGKASLAQALAAEVGATFHAVHGTIVRDVGTLVRILTSLGDRAVLFIDEIHALPRRVAEFLYEALEDRRITVPVTDGVETRAVQIELPAFTMIGATSEVGMLPRPFVERFPIREYLRKYEPAEIAAILVRAAAREGVQVTPEAVAEIAAAARGVPRSALAILSRVRNAAVADDVAIARDLVRRVLAANGVDERGLTAMERHALEVLIDAGGPISLERWAAAAGIAVATLRDQCEPALVERQLVRVTPLGRVACADRARPRAPISTGNWGLVREPDPAEGYRVAG